MLFRSMGDAERDERIISGDGASSFCTGEDGREIIFRKLRNILWEANIVENGELRFIWYFLLCVSFLSFLNEFAKIFDVMEPYPTPYCYEMLSGAIEFP